MNSASSPTTGSDPPRERPRSLTLMTGIHPNRRKQGQSSVGNHDNNAVVNLTADEPMNNINTDQGTATKSSAKKVNNSVANQNSLEPLLASIAVPQPPVASPTKDGSSSSNGSDDLARPTVHAPILEPRQTVHSGFELAGQYPPQMVRADKGRACRAAGAEWPNCGILVVG